MRANDSRAQPPCSRTTPGRPGLTDHPAVTAPVTREMVQARTRELAVLAGRIPPHVEQRDYEQAMRELTGASELDRQQAILDSSPGDKPSRELPEFR